MFLLVRNSRCRLAWPFTNSPPMRRSSEHCQVYGGKVDVSWNVTIEATRRTLRFDWVESRGPPIPQPERQGFGSRLLAYVLPVQIQARSRVDFARHGVRVHCEVPLPVEAHTVKARADL